MTGAHPQDYASKTMAKKQTPFWQFGEQITLAKAAKILPANLNLVLHRKRGVSWPLAVKLETCSFALLGEDRAIPAPSWMNSRTSKHPAFFGKAVKK